MLTNYIDYIVLLMYDRDQGGMGVPTLPVAFNL